MGRPTNLYKTPRILPNFRPVVPPDLIDILTRDLVAIMGQMGLHTLSNLPKPIALTTTSVRELNR
ncbi:MAG: hypothetical protein QNK42_03340 [Pseudodonghicola sp.]|nr:hypothetical protein [Pseudodonghicola sp.]